MYNWLGIEPRSSCSAQFIPTTTTEDDYKMFPGKYLT